MPEPKQLARRAFLKVSLAAGGSLVVGSYLAGCAADAPPAAPTAQSLSTAPIAATQATAALAAVPAAPTQAPTPRPTIVPAADAPFEPNLFVRIDPDGAVTLTVHRSEMGQGVRTALAMILAEELDADWSKIHVEQAPAGNAYGSQITSGSGSITNFYLPLRQAGAKARQILVAAAAQIWGATPDECVAEQGSVVHSATGKRLGYGALAGTAGTIEAPALPPALKDEKTFRLIGTAVPRIDDPAIVTGKATFGLDVRVPGMLFATIARCPVFGGKVGAYDAERAQAVPGVRAVVQVPRGVAVVAEHTWAAIQGRAALKITWDAGPQAGLSSAAIRKQLAELAGQAAARDSATAATTLQATYETPYLAHAPIEPMNCVADVRADTCEIWAPTQNPQDVQSYVAREIGMPTKVNVTLMGGGFGRRLEVDYALEAATVSRAVQAPVQVVWTREDDIRHDFYRQSTYHWMQAGWDATGELGLWRHYVAAEGINGIAYRGGNEVLDEGLETAYAISDQRSQSLLADIPIPTGPWRAVVYAPNAFANECFFDEVAEALRKDPYQLRMELLGQGSRLRPVVELAAARAGWGAPLPKGRGRGIACHNTYGKTAVAMVAEVSVQRGAVRVHKVVCAIDCGRVIQPDIVAQQVEGGIVYGLTSLLKGEITIKAGRVQQGNFDDYPVLRIDEMPEVEVHILPSGDAPQGVGEAGVPPIVPAVANAIFAATGKRIRRTPLRAGDLA